MLDCGIHPSSNDFQYLPFFDVINLNEIDLVLISHFHLDHCGALPYLTQKTNFKGKVFCTHPTKEIFKHIMLDSLKVSENYLFDKEDINNCCNKI